MTITFKSLTPLLNILTKKSFKIQIISLEPLNLFIEYLRIKNIDFNLHFNYNLNINNSLTNDTINIIVPNKSFNNNFNNNFNKNQKIILYSNFRNSDFIQIIFKPTEDEVLEYLQYRKARKNNLNKNNKYKDINKYNNINKDINKYKDNDINKEINKDKDDINKSHNDIKSLTTNDLSLITKMYYNHKSLYSLVTSLLKPKKQFFIKTMSNLESLIILVLINNKKFGQIMESLKKIDNVNNSFQVMMCLNHLVKTKIVKKRGSSYHINVSREYVDFICKEIGYDIEML
ncbi:hypothetical protein DMUE_3321 [Dictyocoela muelleri]|nr:hypothetical protein DMUE_3321 [Dictyocoela muelleri]